jgi:hypothetical protein
VYEHERRVVGPLPRPVRDRAVDVDRPQLGQLGQLGTLGTRLVHIARLAACHDASAGSDFRPSMLVSIRVPAPERGEPPPARRRMTPGPPHPAGFADVSDGKFLHVRRVVGRATHQGGRVRNGGPGVSGPSRDLHRCSALQDRGRARTIRPSGCQGVFFRAPCPTAAVNEGRSRSRGPEPSRHAAGRPRGGA